AQPQPGTNVTSAFAGFHKVKFLGGETVSGYVLESGLESFVGAYPIPVAYGLTVGELARMIKGEGWLSGLDGVPGHVLPRVAERVGGVPLRTRRGLSARL